MDKSRRGLEYAGKVGKNEAIIFNLPKSITKQQIEQICKEQKGVQVMGVSISESLIPGQPAFA